MKKLTYLVVAAMAIGMVACTNGKKAGYVITGTVEGAAEGDSVFLQEAAGRQLNKLDTAIITNGVFTFEGVQDSVVNRYITCKVGEEGMLMDFFLENGTIKMSLTKDHDSATGTSNNDAYQEIRSKVNALNQKLSVLYDAMGDSTLTEEQKETKMKELEQLREAMNQINIEGIKKNITNLVGVELFKKNFYNMTTAENEALLQQIPAKYQNDEVIVKIKDITDRQKKTAVGQKFLDFEMLTPEGKKIKLSDYVGKGKVVLIDFWASWCGPCRREMPSLVDAYAKYKGKNFEIVGVSLDESNDSWKEAIKKLKITWPQMSDLKDWNCEGAQLYAIN
ncbi:MAG: TlpA disulfide reductase family protein, partial [Bacteroides sp.]